MLGVWGTNESNVSQVLDVWGQMSLSSASARCLGTNESVKCLMSGDK